MGLLQFSQPGLVEGPLDEEWESRCWHADLIPNGWKHWLKWDEVVLQHLPGDQSDNKAVDGEEFLEMLRKDAGSNLGFSRVVAQKL
jgi:hypothetical protein